MKNTHKLFGLACIAGLVLAGCFQQDTDAGIIFDTYSIDLQDDDGSLLVNYEFEDPPLALTVTVVNTGTTETGLLYIMRRGADAFAFELSAASLDSIPPGGSDTFTVIPAAILDPGSYTADIEVIGNGIGSGFAVEHIEPAIPYGISLRSGVAALTSHTFYTLTPAALTVTVMNIGDEETGALTIAIEDGDDSFVLSAQTISNITAGSSVDFTVQPEAGLPSDSYSATITVSGGNGISRSFTVYYTVPIVYDIELRDTDEEPIPAVYRYLGSAAEFEQGFTVKVVNTGNAATGNLNVSMSGSDSDSFTFSGPTAIPDIPANGNNSFTITANPDLANRIYNITISVSNSVITESFVINYWVFKQEDFYGTFINTGNRLIAFTENSFLYQSRLAGTNTIDDLDAECEITSWKKVSFTIQDGNHVAFADATPHPVVTAWEITCKVTRVGRYPANAPLLRHVYNLAANNTQLTVGHEFTTWVLCSDPATIRTFSSDLSAGVVNRVMGANIGYRTVTTPRTNTTGWINFILHE